MQRKPEDRVLPYNGQKMLDMIETNLILLLVCIGFKNIFNHNVSILDSIVPHPTMSPY